MTAVKGMIVGNTGINTVNPIFISVKFVKTEFEARYQKNDQASANTQCQPQYIDYCIKFMSRKVSQG
jgi:hypothetical protein